MTYWACCRTEMTSETIRTILEDLADNLFNTDPNHQQGGDMVRVGGLADAIDVAKPIGSRISCPALSDTGEVLDAAKFYTVAGWASVNQSTEGPQATLTASNTPNRR